MDEPLSHIAFSPAVRAQQESRGSRGMYARKDEKGGWRSLIDHDLARFIATRDSFYLSTASADGQPYIQHRGGPPGFLKVLDERTLGFADFAGNRQYITLGNLSENDRAFIFLMDYASRQRIKLWGRARVVEDDPELLARLSDMDYEGRPERVILFDVATWDINCRQHIRPRFTETDIAPAVLKLKTRIAELEAEVARLQETGAE